MTQTLCPYLGLAGDRTTTRTLPDSSHRCYAQDPAGSPDTGYQAAVCLAAAHTGCPFFAAPAAPAPAPEPRRKRPVPAADWRRYLPWAALGLLLVTVAAVYIGDLLRPPAAAPPSLPAAAPAAASATPAAEAPSPAPPASAAQAAPPTPAAATAEPGGRALALAPKAGDAGWWSSAEASSNHLGDSYLYAGQIGGQVFISAARIELAAVPRGAPIRAASLRLTGLEGSRFDPAAGGTWSVQLLAADAVKEYVRADFQALFNAPAAVSLVPTFYPADLAPGRANEVVLDASARDWLDAQVAAGAAAVIARIIGPTGGGDTLFAWDSGAGPATLGEGIALALVMGPPPATPPPLPTEAVIVATLTPTPANILTVAADAWTATAVAATTGTPAPRPYRVVTPTPQPANLATVQALALARGLPPIVPSTPAPGNRATATLQALYAAAAAFLTGTPTATPQGAVTPIVITPTPQPANVLTVAARILAATAQVKAPPAATPTPWAYNVVVATVTPPYIIIQSTPTPANQATAQADAANATAVALVFGANTPLPPNAVTATPVRPTAAPPQAGNLCPDPRAQIAALAPGQAIAGRFDVLGTATHANFASWKLEIAAGAAPTGGYTTFATGAAPVQGGMLATLDTAAYGNGTYTLRLTVVDRTGNYPPPCQVVVAISN